MNGSAGLKTPHLSDGSGDALTSGVMVYDIIEVGTTFEAKSALTLYLLLNTQIFHQAAYFVTKNKSVCSVY
jgi:hypothetical protein